MKREITSENAGRAKSTLPQQTPNTCRPEFISGPQKAFTLAEVLVTLAIIGIVAALTIPTVVRNYREKQTATQLKKAYSQFTQAFNMAQSENGTIDTWNWYGAKTAEGAMNIYNIIKPLKLSKSCGLGAGCMYEGNYKLLNGENYGV